MLTTTTVVFLLIFSADGPRRNLKADIIILLSKAILTAAWAGFLC